MNSKLFSESVENYLKTIYGLCQEEGGAPTQKIAARLGVSAPGVTKMLHYLSRHQLIEHTPYQPVRLTGEGEKIALELIRHHRLIELYLMECLGYGWEKVHEEAERLEHYISEEFEDSIERLLGFPKFDPHGDPIPTRDGEVAPLVTATLDAQPEGHAVVIRRVTDEDAALLIYLADCGLRPGAVVRVLSRDPFGGSLQVEVEERLVRVSPQAAQNVYVEDVSGETCATDF